MCRSRVVAPFFKLKGRFFLSRMARWASGSASAFLGPMAGLLGQIGAYGSPGQGETQITRCCRRYSSLPAALLLV